MNVGGVLISNNSDRHPPESWAAVTAAMIFAVDNDIDPGRRIAAMRLQTAIAEALVPHHDRVQQEERDALDGNENYHTTEHRLDEEHLGKVVQAVLDAARGSPWEEQFNAPEMDRRIRALVADHFVTAQAIERQVYRRNRGMPQHLPHPGEEWQRAADEATAQELADAEERAARDNHGEARE